MRLMSKVLMVLVSAALTLNFGIGCNLLYPQVEGALQTAAGSLLDTTQSCVEGILGVGTDGQILTNLAFDLINDSVDNDIDEWIPDATTFPN
jgi:hypothetical protein